MTANQLSLGCDCLGYIKYFDGFRADSKGNPILLKNVTTFGRTPFTQLRGKA